jgi:hypothetical protein
MAGFETPLYRQNTALTAEERLANIEDILRLTLLTAGGTLPVTQIATAFVGSRIGTTNQYRELYKNNFLRLIAVKVVADFDTVAPGVQQASLSLTTDLSNYARIDKLVEGVKDTSGTIWLKPDQSLYINTADTGVTLNGSQYRVLMFDPLSFAGYLNSGI